MTVINKIDEYLENISELNFEFKFKIGDRVKIFTKGHEKHGFIGKIISIQNPKKATVEFDDGMKTSVTPKDVKITTK